MENEWKFEELQKKAIEAMEKRYEDYFIQSHEMLMRAKKRREDFKIDENVNEQFARMETNHLLDEISPLNNILNTALSDMRRKEMEQIEHILRHWIDDPIIGVITKDSLRQRCIRTVLYKEYNEMDSKLEQSGNNITLTISSRLLGVVQGDYLIGIDGQRSLLTEEQNRRLFEMGV